ECCHRQLLCCLRFV
uniref:Tau-conotoxin CnVA n=2 Tax=Conus consors TaxID=101297 RepID=CT5A_CONCN|nr:RecName: Full=Tau-conotoxin CnVA; AltName: Full=Tau-CnVA [Conus consors]